MYPELSKVFSTQTAGRNPPCDCAGAILAAHCETGAVNSTTATSFVNRTALEYRMKLMTPTGRPSATSQPCRLTSDTMDVTTGADVKVSPLQVHRAEQI